MADVPASFVSEVHPERSSKEIENMTNFEFLLPSVSVTSILSEVWFYESIKSLFCS
jgi:hypothetical protein